MSGNWPGGQAYLPASQLAVQHVNANGSILADYELVLIERDTEVGESYNFFRSQAIRFLIFDEITFDMFEMTYGFIIQPFFYH